MEAFLKYFKLAAVLVAAFMLGNWFLAEAKKAKLTDKPWYTPYLSIPGVTIVVLMVSAVLFAIFRTH